jgi:gluconate 2-dehydrogenase gamma chain
MNGITRRDWVLAAACWADVLVAQAPSQHFSSFDAGTAAEIEAIAESIIPGDGTPGAREAGVIRFIDRALSGYEKDKREIYRNGLADLQTKRAELFPGSTTIAGLSGDQRTALLKPVEGTEFFRLVRMHTILGFFGHPKHGGNRDAVGFKLLGMETSAHFQPPFGYYDREAEK